jgi:DNA-binding MarR family transcriptional regulator
MALGKKDFDQVEASAARRRAPGYKLEDQVGHLLRRANQRHTSIFFDGLNDQKLTPTQFAALIKIGDEEEVSQNRLGRLTAMDPATILGVVKRLQERKLIDAHPDPVDRRRSLWRLSAAGQRLLEEVLPIAAQITRHTLAPLDSGERRVLLELLRKLS